MRSLEEKPRQTHSRVFRYLSKKNVDSSELKERCQAIEDYLAVSYFHAEVQNGGFIQFFSNFGGRNCRNVAEALRRIGAVEQLRVFQSFLRALPEDLDVCDSIAVGTLMVNDRTLASQLESFDADYYAQKDSFYEAMINFANENGLIDRY